MDTWDDKQTGQKRNKLRVVGENMQLLGGRPAVAARRRDRRRPSKPAQPRTAWKSPRQSASRTKTKFRFES